jgi:hypothetical protein
MSASAGEASIPAPVSLGVNGLDVALMWRAVQQQHHGVNEPWVFWAGVAQVVVNIPIILSHGNGLAAWSSLGSGLLSSPFR